MLSPKMATILDLVEGAKPQSLFKNWPFFTKIAIFQSMIRIQISLLIGSFRRILRIKCHTYFHHGSKNDQIGQKGQFSKKGSRAQLLRPNPKWLPFLDSVSKMGSILNFIGQVTKSGLPQCVCMCKQTCFAFLLKITNAIYHPGKNLVVVSMQRDNGLIFCM